MKTVVFSDTHLALPFDQKKFDFLIDLIERFDRIIINGDFWDGYLISFDEFVNSKWNMLFPHLLNKETIYVYGNHDKESQSDTRRSLFSKIQTKKYILETRMYTYQIEHGNRLSPFVDETDGFVSPPWVQKSFSVAEYFIVNHLPKRIMKVTHGRFNNKIKKLWLDESKENQILVTGHTHFAEIDLESRFINTGFVNHGLGHYLSINEEGKSNSVVVRY